MKSLSLSVLISLMMTMVHAHEASTSYLYWQEQHPSTLRLDMAVTDLMVHFNTGTQEKLSWSELQLMSGSLGQYLLDGLKIRQGESVCPIKSELQGITHYTGEAFASWQIHWRCPNLLQATTLSYRLLFAQDTLHRAILSRDGVLTSDIQILGRASTPVTLTSKVWPAVAAVIVVVSIIVLLGIRRLRR